MGSAYVDVGALRIAETADEPVLYDSGWSPDCVDDQGTTFNLSVPAAKYTQQGERRGKDNP